MSLKRDNLKSKRYQPFKGYSKPLFGLRVPTWIPVVVGMHATYCNLEPKLRFEISKHCRHPGLKLTRHCLEQLL